MTGQAIELPLVVRRFDLLIYPARPSHSLWLPLGHLVPPLCIQRVPSAGLTTMFRHSPLGRIDLVVEVPRVVFVALGRSPSGVKRVNCNCYIAPRDAVD